MTAPPPHCAAAHEPIPPLRGDRSWEGPDLNGAMPIEQMLDCLHQLDDDEVAYLALWLRLANSVGCDPIVDFERDGSRGLMYGSPVDSQHRHRSRWMHFLLEDLEMVEGRKELLGDYLEERGRIMDRRPRDPRATTNGLRDFIRTGGRLLLTPAGRVSIGGGVPRALIDGTDDEVEACRAATLAFLDVRKRLRADPQLKRALRMLGTRTSNGWHVLENAA